MPFSTNNKATTSDENKNAFGSILTKIQEIFNFLKVFQNDKHRNLK